MELRTKRLVLEELRVSHAKPLFQHINNLNVAKQTANIPHPASLDTIQENFRTYRKQKPRKEYRFAIVIKGAAIGSISAHHIDRHHGTTTIGYWLSESYWGKGIMSEALQALCEFLFNKLKLRRIEADVYLQNKGSIRVLEKAGFKREGRKRSVVKAKSTGKIHDVYIYGLLREDWIKR
jgi:[ribosomal protein S5]-alanine N-acetyltransferase